MTSEPMEQWVIYDHPRDYPDNVVVRCWRIYRGFVRPTAEVWLRDSHDAAREVIRANFPGGHRLERFDEDDPTIVEVWI